MNIPPIIDLPAELLKYTPEQLSTAPVALIVADVQRFAAEVQGIDDIVKRLEASGGDTLFPKLSEGFKDDATAVFTAGAQMIAQVRVVTAATQEIRTRAASVRAEYERYAAEVRAVLDKIQSAPRG